jgi:hypothetical protein
VYFVLFHIKAIVIIEAGSSNKDITRKTVRILGICLLVGILIYLLTKNTDGISISVHDDSKSLSHSSGDSFSISFQDILSVAETQGLDLVKSISGIEKKYYKFGLRENNEFGEYDLCINANIDRYIVVKTSNDTFVINYESVGATDSYYKTFMELLQKIRAEAFPG